MSDQDRAHRLQEQLVPVLAGSGVEIDNVVVSQAGKRRLVRITVVRELTALAPDDSTSKVAPVTLDEVADVSRLISDALDGPAGSAVLGSSPYVLEVSSAGTDAPLTTPAAFRRAVGRLVELRPREAAPVTGRLMSATADTLVLAADDGSTTDYALSEIARGLMQVEFTHAGQDAGDIDDQDIDDQDIDDQDSDDQEDEV